MWRIVLSMAQDPLNKASAFAAGDTAQSKKAAHPIRQHPTTAEILLIINIPILWRASWDARRFYWRRVWS
jgi:hypothetical protein